MAKTQVFITSSGEIVLVEAINDVHIMTYDGVAWRVLFQGEFFEMFKSYSYLGVL